MRKVLLTIFSGCTFKVYQTMNADTHPLSEPTFYRIQKILCVGIVEVCKDLLQEYREELFNKLAQNQLNWVAALNGAWAHRGWKSRQHTFIVRAVLQNKVVCAIILRKKHVVKCKTNLGTYEEKTVLEGNYFGTSKGMEGEAFILALDEIKDSGL